MMAFYMLADSSNLGYYIKAPLFYTGSNILVLGRDKDLVYHGGAK